MPISQFLELRKTSQAENEMEPNKVRDPQSLRSLLTYEVVVSSANYALLSLMEISFWTTYPIFLSTPISDGGLGLSSRVIGKIMSIFGIFIGIFQICFFARVNKRWGTKKVFMGGLASSLPAFALFPIISCLVRRQGYTLAVWVAMGLQVMFSVFWNTSFGLFILQMISDLIDFSLPLFVSAIFIFIAAASPSHASVGATVGFNQVCRLIDTTDHLLTLSQQRTVSSMRAIGPAAANPLFSLSVSKGYLGGNLVYYVLMFGAAASLFAGCFLPKHVKTTRSWQRSSFLFIEHDDFDNT